MGICNFKTGLQPIVDALLGTGCLALSKVILRAALPALRPNQHCNGLNYRYSAIVKFFFYAASR